MLSARQTVIISMCERGEHFIDSALFLSPPCHLFSHIDLALSHVTELELELELELERCVCKTESVFAWPTSSTDPLNTSERDHVQTCAAYCSTNILHYNKGFYLGKNLTNACCPRALFTVLELVASITCTWRQKSINGLFS